MADSVFSLNCRTLVASYMAKQPGVTVPQPTKIAIGSGGHLSASEIKPVDDNRTALYNQVAVKDIGTLLKNGPLIVTATVQFSGSEITGGIISEAAVLDANNNIIGVQHFLPQNIVSTGTYTIAVELAF